MTTDSARPGATRAPARDFRDLVVWRKAHALVLEVYRFTQTFPRQEMFGLMSQMRRAAVSVPANIAEGFRRKSAADKLRFLNIAQGSLEELRYYMILSEDLQYGKKDGLWQQGSEVGKILNAYMAKIRQKPKDP